MTPESLAILDGLMTAAAIDLFSGYGVTVTYSGQTSATDLPGSATVAGVIGFSGEEIRGSVLLASTEALFARATPPRARGEHGGREREWAAELTNQLLGRLKNRLYGRGVVLSASTPTALSGGALAVASAATQQVRAYAFRNDDAEIWVRIDVVDEGVDLTTTRDDGAEAAREGDILIF
jgi:CheY-specific phosphatase CheX